MSGMDAKLDQINLVSGDLAASIAFYRRLGLKIPEERVWKIQNSINHVSAGKSKSSAIDVDIDSIAFARLWNEGSQGRQDLRRRIVVGFKLPSRPAVDATYDDLTGAGYVGLQVPYGAYPGSRYAIIKDPDGIAVGLMSPRPPEARSAPPQI